MTTKFKLATMTFVVAVAAAPLAAQTAATAKTKKDSTASTTTTADKSGWIQLFDGKDLTGWRGYKKTDASETRWKIEDGLLTLPSNGAGDTHGQRDLITDATFDQFDLRWEWKISQGGNSGVKYFVLEDRNEAIGHEYQMIDDERHPDAKIGPHRQTAAFYDVFPAHDRPIKPAGEWNTSEVIVKGKHVTHILNGKPVLEYDLESPATQAAIEKSKFKGIERFGKPQNGHILVQDHGDQVWYRKIEIKRLK
jgi:3-keto-disaccharide hydrolase